MGSGRHGCPSVSAEAYAAVFEPFQTFERSRSWLVFAPDPAPEPGLVDQPKEIAIVQFAVVRFAAIRRISQLIVPRKNRVLSDGHRDVALHHLAMIKVELQPHIGLTDLEDHGARFARAAEQKARDVARIN